MIRNLLNHIRLLAGDQRGQTFVEYALLTAVVSIGAVATLTAFGVSVAEMFDGIWERFPDI